MLCQKCYGTGQYMGHGMMIQNCDCDEDNTKKTESNRPKTVQIDKRSKAYRDAINRLMQENEIDRDEAAKVFEEEFYKIA